MGTKSTAIQSWALPTCGYACAFCYPEDADIAEALACPVATDAQPARQRPAAASAVRMGLIQVVDRHALLARQDDVFADVRH
jgi:hypothetical protein